MSATSLAEPRRESPPRRRILDTATGLFYAEGIHSVGIDRIIATAGVAKATFYRHFPAKDDLVRAYLEEQSRLQRTVVAQAPEAEPLETVLTIFEWIGAVGCGEGFRGCAFVNAAAEYPDPGHPVRLAIADHRAWFRGTLAELLTAAGHQDAGRTADLLVMIRDGIVVGSELDDPAAVRDLIRTAVSRLLAV